VYNHVVGICLFLPTCLFLLVLDYFNFHLNSTASNTVLHLMVGRTKNLHYSIDDLEKKLNVLSFLVKTILTYFSVKIMCVDSKGESTREGKRYKHLIRGINHNFYSLFNKPSFIFQMTVLSWFPFIHFWHVKRGTFLKVQIQYLLQIRFLNFTTDKVSIIFQNVCYIFIFFLSGEGWGINHLFFNSSQRKFPRKENFP